MVERWAFSSEIARSHGTTSRISRQSHSRSEWVQDPARLFAVPVSGYTLVVGQATDDNEESLTTLRLLLGIGLPVALILASFAGYAVAAAALRPVEAMRRKAADVSDERPGERADGVVVFQRPSFKQSNETLFLQMAESGAVDRPALAPIGFGITSFREVAYGGR